MGTTITAILFSCALGAFGYAYGLNLDNAEARNQIIETCKAGKSVVDISGNSHTLYNCPTGVVYILD